MPSDQRRSDGVPEESAFEGVIKETQRPRLGAPIALESAREPEAPTASPLAIPIEMREAGVLAPVETVARSIIAESLRVPDRRLRANVGEEAGLSSTSALMPGAGGVARLVEAQVTRLPPLASAGGSSICVIHLAENITRMVKEGVHSAVIRLAPEGLGELEIRLTLDGKGVSVEFGSPLESTRGLLEQAIPRLSEIMTQGGLTLNHTQVLSGLSREGWVVFGRPLMALERPQQSLDPPVSDDQTPQRPGKRRLLDLYA